MCRLTKTTTICLILTALLSFNLTAEEVDRSALNNERLISRLEQPHKQQEDILFEIERINQQIEKLEASGQLSGTTKLAIAGLLGTIAYGVIHANLVWIFNPEFYQLHGIAAAVYGNQSWVNAVLRGILDTALPGLAISALLGFANESSDNLPSIHIAAEDLAKVGVIAVVSTLAITTFFATTCAVLRMNCLSFGGQMFTAAIYSMPMMSIILVAKVYEKRVQLKSLKDQLKEYREELDRRQNRDINQPQPERLPAPLEPGGMNDGVSA